MTVDLPWTGGGQRQSDRGAAEERKGCRFVFHAIHVIPPWLRPRIRGVRHGVHPLTASYARLMHALCCSKASREHRQQVPRLLAQCVGDVLSRDVGAGKFLRREVLGRRLTRSARAVIVPRPDLRIDQIAIPADVLDVIFEGLPEANRRFVLVHRNPTLHRYGLLAMRPVRSTAGGAVFGLPLGILDALGADFDGDQAAVVALETDEAVAEAQRLLPGADGMRVDPFRAATPAFRLCKELADPDREWEVAANRQAGQEQWCQVHQELVRQRINEVGDGWEAAQVFQQDELFEALWRGLDERRWLERAEQSMRAIYRSVRRKGRLGGVFRRFFYRQPFTRPDAFFRSVAAMQAVTERLAQSSLSIKTEQGASEFPADRFFTHPAAPDCEAWLRELDKTLSWPAVREALQPAVAKPQVRGLLAWLAEPTAETLFRQLEQGPAPASASDPRLSWFLA